MSRQEVDFMGKDRCNYGNTEFEDPAENPENVSNT